MGEGTFIDGSRQLDVGTGRARSFGVAVMRAPLSRPYPSTTIRMAWTATRAVLAR
jgi:hypothetical protein